MSSQTTPPVFSPVETNNSSEGLRDIEYKTNRGFCCWFPCFRSRSNDTVWERISTSSSSEKEERGWVAKGVNAFMKVREWSELVAGPKWKTFIRRFNKNRCKTGKFHYDPLSYAMNFDEGQGQNSQLEDEILFRGFSARYATVAGSTKSMECGKDAPRPPAIV